MKKTDHNLHFFIKKLFRFLPNGNLCWMQSDNLYWLWKKLSTALKWPANSVTFCIHCYCVSKGNWTISTRNSLWFKAVSLKWKVERKQPSDSIIFLSTFITFRLTLNSFSDKLKRVPLSEAAIYGKLIIQFWRIQFDIFENQIRSKFSFHFCKKFSNITHVSTPAVNFSDHNHTVGHSKWKL